MKKVSLLIAMIAFVCGNMFAQSYNFDQYNVGDKVAQSIGQPWTTWSNLPGSDEDAAFSDEQAVSGTNSVKFTYGNDQVYNFNDETTGSYTLDWNMYIPSGKDAYLNIQHNFTGGQDGEWAFGLYFNTAEQGTALHVSDAYHDFTFPFDTWFPVHFDIDLDSDAISLTIDGVEVHSWAFSETENSTTPGMRVLDALDFYPPTNASTSVFYIDDFTFVSSQEDEEIIGESFEEYTVGNKIAQSAVAAGHDYWTTWSNTPGGSNDGTVSDDYASEGSNSGLITGNTDQVLLLGGFETGVFDFEFDMYTPAGKDGYFNMLHYFAGDGSKTSQWAMQAYVNAEADETNSNQWHSTGHGTVFAGGVTADIPAVEDEWMHFRIHVNCDTDVATLYFNEAEICSWQWSMESFGNEQQSRVIDGANFFPAVSSSTSQFYIDNIHFTRIGGESAPQFVITPDAINGDLMEDDMTTFEVVLDNQGNSIGDWSGWIEFPQGGAGSQTAELYYHNGVSESGIGYSEGMTREMAIRLPASAYAGAAMGMRITSVKYLTRTDYKAEDDTYIFRVYVGGVNNQPGELLAEKTVVSSELGTWIEATFDEPVYLTGQTYWVSVFLNQAADEYPLNMDGAHNGEESDGNWLSSRGGNFSHCYSEGNFEGAWLITVNCQGELVPATWVTMDKNNGSVLGGQSETITLTLNSIGLPMGTNYNSTLVINTNDEDLPIVEIPVALAVTDGVVETATQLASIYPNPATSVVTLEGDNLNSVAIYNVAGQLVRVVKLDSMVNNIDMNVEAGVYFFSIYDNNGRNSVQRVVIVK
jgi:hypothetical protein